MQEMVSIIIPNYNNGRFLLQCVNSVIEQSYEKLEIIIVDDASVDQSQSIIQELMRRDQRVRAIYLEVNGGVSHARNIGIEYAKGTYITFLDADDMYSSSHKIEREMEEIYEQAIKGRDIAAYSRVVYIDEDGKALSGGAKEGECRSGNIWKRLLLTADTTIIPRDYCIKKEKIEELKGYNEKRSLYEDYELTLRLSKHTDFIYTGENGTAYRLKKNGLSDQSRRESNKVFLKIFEEQIKYEIGYIRNWYKVRKGFMMAKKYIKDNLYFLMERRRNKCK